MLLLGENFAASCMLLAHVAAVGAVGHGAAFVVVIVPRDE